MATNGQSTQTQDTTYNLVSVLDHALEGSVMYQKCASDAGSDNELQQYFSRLAERTNASAEEAKRLLKTRLEGSATATNPSFAEHTEIAHAMKGIDFPAARTDRVNGARQRYLRRRDAAFRAHPGS